MKSPEEYLKEPYQRVLIWDEESGTYFAQISEFPGCFTDGSTATEALNRLQDTASSWIMSAQNLGQEIPKPFAINTSNGRVALRMPKSLHRKAIEAAKREDVSLNQFIVSAVSEAVGVSRPKQETQQQVRSVVLVLTDVQVTPNIEFRVDPNVSLLHSSSSLLDTSSGKVSWNN